MNQRTIPHRVAIVGVALAIGAAAPAEAWQASDGASAIAYSRDGNRIVDGGSSATIHVRDADSGAIVSEIHTKSGTNGVAFSPDGATVAAGRTNGSRSNLQIFRVADGVRVLLLSGHQNATRSVAFSSSGTMLASGGDDRTAKLWRVSDGALLRTFANGSDVRSIALTSDDGTLATGDEAGRVRLWRVFDGTLVRTLTGFAGLVTQVAFSPDRTLVAASSLDGTLRLWRVSDGTLVRTLRLPPSTPNGNVTALAFHPSGALLVTGNDEVTPAPEHGTLRFYRVSDGTSQGVISQQTGVFVGAVAFSPTGDALAYTRGVDGVLTVVPFQ